MHKRWIYRSQQNPTIDLTGFPYAPPTFPSSPIPLRLTTVQLSIMPDLRPQPQSPHTTAHHSALSAQLYKSSLKPAPASGQCHAWSAPVVKGWATACLTAKYGTNFPHLDQVAANFHSHFVDGAVLPHLLPTDWHALCPYIGPRIVLQSYFTELLTHPVPPESHPDPAPTPDNSSLSPRSNADCFLGPNSDLNLSSDLDPAHQQKSVPSPLCQFAGSLLAKPSTSPASHAPRNSVDTVAAAPSPPGGRPSGCGPRPCDTYIPQPDIPYPQGPPVARIPELCPDPIPPSPVANPGHPQPVNANVGGATVQAASPMLPPLRGRPGDAPASFRKMMWSPSKFSHAPLIDNPWTPDPGLPFRLRLWQRIKHMALAWAFTFCVVRKFGFKLVDLPFLGVGLAATWVCVEHEMVVGFNPGLFVSLLVFPLSFAVNAAYVRREQALQYLSVVKGCALSLHLHHQVCKVRLREGGTDGR